MVCDLAVLAAKQCRSDVHARDRTRDLRLDILLTDQLISCQLLLPSAMLSAHASARALHSKAYMCTMAKKCGAPTKTFGHPLYIFIYEFFVKAATRADVHMKSQRAHAGCIHNIQKYTYYNIYRG